MSEVTNQDTNLEAKQPPNAPMVVGVVESKSVLGSGSSRSRKRLFIVAGISLAVLIVAAGAVVWATRLDDSANTALQGLDTSKPADQSSPVGSEALPSGLKAPSKLVYSYHEGTRAYIRELDVAGGIKRDLVGFDTYKVPHEISPWSVLRAEGSETAGYGAQGEYAYVASDGLYVGIEGAFDKKISITREEVPNGDVALTQFVPTIERTVSVPGPYSIFSPRIGADGEVYFGIGYYEGATVGRYNENENTITELTNSFRYITLSATNGVYEVTGPPELRSAHLFAGNYLNGDVMSEQFYDDGNSIGAIEIIEWVSDRNWRTRLVSIDSKSGVARALSGEANYESMVITPDKWWLVENLSSTYTIQSYYPISGELTGYKLLDELAGKQLEYLVFAQGLDEPILTAYEKTDGGYKVHVLDILSGKVIGIFDLAEVSEFQVLGVVRE